MKIALLSDIHGNLVALDAVLADARSQGVDQFWIIGDFSAIGPEPVAVLGRLADLESAVCIRGNTDRYLYTGEAPPPDLTQVLARPELVPLYANIAASFAWTRGYVTAGSWLEWFERLPLDGRLTLPSGVRMLAVHASPGTDDGEGVHPGRSSGDLRALLGDADADVVFVGHTHEPMARRLENALLVNLGSVSNPKGRDVRASYVVLAATASGTQLEFRRVAYDYDAFAESVRRSRHPAAAFILSHQRGEQRGRTPHRDHIGITPGEPIPVADTSVFVAASQ
jgi:predicted phosphodiesterase